MHLISFIASCVLFSVVSARSKLDGFDDGIELATLNPKCDCANNPGLCPGAMWWCPVTSGCHHPGQPCPKINGLECPLCPPKGKATGARFKAPVHHRVEHAPVPAPPAPKWTPSKTWTAPGFNAGEVLQPIDVNAPPAHLFPPSTAHYMPPRRVEPAGMTPDRTPHQTNKFWANWISGKANSGQKNIFTMPYALLWSDEDKGWKCHYYDSDQSDAWCKRSPKEGNSEYHFFGPDGTCGHCHCCRRAVEIRAELQISHADVKYKYAKGEREGRIAYYISRFSADFSIGVAEETSSEHYAVVQEDLLGLHAVVRGADRSKEVRFPVYRGMAYISGKFKKFTPRIASPQGYIKKYEKVSNGIFKFVNDAGDPDKTWECHYYEKNENDAWCRGNPITKTKGGDREHKFFRDTTDQKSPCGVCDCCARPVPDPKLKGKDWGKEYRVYVMDLNGNPMSGDFSNTTDGRGFIFSKQVNGWVRLAHVVDDEKDPATLDKYAPSVVWGVSLGVKANGEFDYTFETQGNSGVDLMHWAWGHQAMLFQGSGQKTIDSKDITHILAPTKGRMKPILGRHWKLKIDLAPAQQLNFLPAGKPAGGKRDIIRKALEDGLKNDIAAEQCMKASWSTMECEKPRTFLFTNGFYTNGKGLQKVATYCLLADEFFGNGDARTQKCIDLLQRAFECHYDLGKGCGGVPKFNYDKAWGGAASKQGFDTKMCGLADFGNACYNDHHYHYGYFIHAGALLLKLRPQMLNEHAFVAYVNTLVRDIANPSTRDRYFPQFRAFDWWDLHSWSHGVTPSADGKDEESTSEDVNAYFGIQMWGRETKFKNLERTGEFLVSLLSHSARNIFLMQTGNTFHHPDYVSNHVTGIFFEAKAHYGTFFGAGSQYIHGIQMLPLSPALLLSRTREFCKQEWDDILSKLNIQGLTSGWGSLLMTGNLALVDKERAFAMLQGLSDEGYDKGLSRAWAYYWAASVR